MSDQGEQGARHSVVVDRSWRTPKSHLVDPVGRPVRPGEEESAPVLTLVLILLGVLMFGSILGMALWWRLS
jgi:hypothetical protein